MKKLNYIILLFAGALLTTTSCLKDLDTIPLDEDVITSETVYQDADNYINVLAKCYLGLAVGGNSGGDGEADISGIDGGFSGYLRQYWKHQELTTDEAVIAWNDQTIKDLHYQTWGTSDVFVSAMYYRIMYQVSICNEFIRNSTPGKLSDRGIGSDMQSKIAVMNAEARFLRALSYYHGLDMFRNPPFVTEDDPVGAFFPPQTNAEDLFTYIESELLAITDGEGNNDLMDIRTNVYGRADKAAAYMLLAKLYLNAKVYLGTETHPETGDNFYTLTINNVNKVINGGYSLEPVYQHLFMADNHTSDEIVFPIAFDGNSTQTWGGTTLLVHAAIGGSMEPGNYGVSSGWGGLRTTKELVNKFGDITTTNDSRAIFYTDGQNLEIENVGLFTDGYAVPKFTNIASDSTAGKDIEHVDTDFPLFRLADAYLMYAEAVKRGGNGDEATAVGYINALRERAYGDASGNITAAELTLDFIIDERARELMWEAHRRTDLVRFGLFTGGDYLWEWKGFTKDGRATDSHRDIFPIPTNDLNANPNLVQNPDYN